MKNNFPERLNEAMKDKDFSPSDLSRKSGIDKSSISRYRSGNYDPGKKNFFLLADALDVNPAWLAGEDAPKHAVQSLIDSEPWEDDWQKNPLSSRFDTLSDDESHVVTAYRSADQSIQAAVRKLLDVEDPS